MHWIKKMTAMQALALGFALIILAGAGLLMLPVANRGGDSLSFLDALFTATSATCVTGLVVVDTYQQFTAFGQLIIMLLIQIGGLGFMTIAVLFAMILKKRIGLKERAYLKEMGTSLQLAGIVRMTRQILIGTAVIELTGAVLLAFRFVPQLGWRTGIWYSIFHSVSAFCNAGFDLMGRFSPCSSLVDYQSDWLVLGTIMTLIVVGGIGFVVWNDILEKKWHVTRYKMHTKIMLTGTAVLIVGFAALLYVLEADASMAGMSYSDRILTALFHSISPRTAGFNSVELASMSDGGSMITMLAMMVGAGPGSTAGGIKVSTFAVLILALAADIRKTEDINVYGRRLEPGAVRRACAATALYLFLVLVGVLVILAVDAFPLHDVLFECLSAMGTVGLTRGITGSLEPVSRLVLISLMYAGRVGSLSIVMAFVERKQGSALRKPIEKIIIG